jgi:hypothetical protein
MWSQVTDYQLRGTALEKMNMAEFFTNTWEHEAKDTEEPVDHNDQHRRPGRKPNTRVSYLDEHPCKGKLTRVVRTSGHNTLPDFVGKWFPRGDDPDSHPFYCACMLLLLKPWRDVATDLKEADETWKEALDKFKSASSKKVLDILENTQYFHECQTAADRDEGQWMPKADPLGDEANGGETTYELGEDGIYDVEDDEYTEAGLARLLANQRPWREEMHGKMAVELAKQARLLEENSSWTTGGFDENLRRATADDINSLLRWKAQMMRVEENSMTGTEEPRGDPASVEALTASTLHACPKDAQVELVEPNVEVPVSKLNPTHLKTDQRRAYEIMTWHLDQTLSHAPNLPPLRMILYGEGGTGKSAVIQTVTDAFEERGVNAILLKAAYTGVAASLIQGKTLHTIGNISVDESGQVSLSDETKEKLQKFWKDRTYLIIDEHSMISKSFLAKLSRHIGVGKGADAKLDQSFGGINVILCGDLHQFPPVATARQNALFYRDPPRVKDPTDAILGRQIYEEFTTVVILKEQMRVVDPVWRAFLDRLRHGKVEPKDLEMLRRLVITNPECPPRDFAKYPWQDMRLVTPRHAVRRHWNEAAIREHCFKKKKTLIVCPAQDLCRGRPLTIAERYGLAIKMKGAKRAKGGEDVVEFAIGAQVLVTQNIDVDIDVTNGARGEVVGVVLDPDEEDIDEDATIVELRKMPKCVLVKMTRTRAERLEGLEDGVIPIEPRTMPILVNVRLREGKMVKRTIKRTQFTMTAAYGFTDYRSQGQTIPTILVDVAKPPSGKIDLFNLYVALSRSSGRDTIRLLRDFEDDMFLTVHDPELAIEDDRLKRLDEQTEKWWKRMKEEHAKMKGGEAGASIQLQCT